jgi:hypothetical protein
VPDDTRSPTGRTARPLTEGYVRKGGRNAFPSQVTDRPPPPAPMKIKDVDFAQVEMRILFMAGYAACFRQQFQSKMGVGDQAEANKSFEQFVKNYGNAQ